VVSEPNQGAAYCIWAADNVVYGPVELPTLIGWVKDERVLAETWVFDLRNDRWRKAASLLELQLQFRNKAASPRPAPNLDTTPRAAIRDHPGNVAPGQGPAD